MERSFIQKDVQARGLLTLLARVILNIVIAGSHPTVQREWGLGTSLWRGLAYQARLIMRVLIRLDVPGVFPQACASRVQNCCGVPKLEKSVGAGPRCRRHQAHP